MIRMVLGPALRRLERPGQRGAGRGVAAWRVPVQRRDQVGSRPGELAEGDSGRRVAVGVADVTTPAVAAEFLALARALGGPGGISHAIARHAIRAHGAPLDGYADLVAGAITITHAQRLEHHGECPLLDARLPLIAGAARLAITVGGTGLGNVWLLVGKVLQCHAEAGRVRVLEEPAHGAFQIVPFGFA